MLLATSNEAEPSLLPTSVDESIAVEPAAPLPPIGLAFPFPPEDLDELVKTCLDEFLVNRKESALFDSNSEKCEMVIEYI